MNIRMVDGQYRSLRLPDELWSSISTDIPDVGVTFSSISTPGTISLWKDKFRPYQKILLKDTPYVDSDFSIEIRNKSNFSKWDEISNFHYDDDDRWYWGHIMMGSAFGYPTEFISRDGSIKTLPTKHLVCVPGGEAFKHRKKYQPRLWNNSELSKRVFVRLLFPRIN